MDAFLSTREMAWVLGRSQGTVRDMIREGEIEGVRLPAGFRVPKSEAETAGSAENVNRGRPLCSRHPGAYLFKIRGIRR